MEVSLISSIRQQLAATLAENYETYLQRLRDWFGQRICKDLFDLEMAPFLHGEALELHNQMMIVILSQCGGDISYSPSNEDNENTDDVEMEEEEDPTWLYPVTIRRKEPDEEIPVPDVTDRFPPQFAYSYQRAHRGDYDYQVNIVPNVTHSYKIQNRLDKEPELKPYFKPPIAEDQPYLSTEASIYGKFLLRAWSLGLDGVDRDAAEWCVKACRDHIKNIVTALIKTRKPFRMRDKKFCHSIGAPYPNPYLLQGQHIYEDHYSSDSTKLADVMQIPSLLPTQEEKERLAALEVAAAAPTRGTRFRNSASLGDLLDTIQDDPYLIPRNKTRLRICETILQNYKGYYGSPKDVYINNFEEDNRDTLPACSY